MYHTARPAGAGAGRSPCCGQGGPGWTPTRIRPRRSRIVSADAMGKRSARGRPRIKTMEEFSAASGISRPTVSRYFNDPESVRPATRERIEKALREVRYSPNLFATNFNRRKPRTFGMIVPSLTDPFYADLVERVELRALQEGYWTIVLTSHGERAMEARAIQMLMSLRVAGAIVAPLGQSSELALLKDLRGSVPLVLLNSRVDMDASFVGTDNFQSIALIVDYLHRTGEPPCFFDMPSVNRNAIERREAYLETMRGTRIRAARDSGPLAKLDSRGRRLRAGGSILFDEPLAEANDPVRDGSRRVRSARGGEPAGVARRPFRPGKRHQGRGPRRSSVEPVREPLADDGRAGFRGDGQPRGFPAGARRGRQTDRPGARRPSSRGEAGHARFRVSALRVARQVGDVASSSTFGAISRTCRTRRRGR